MRLLSVLQAVCTIFAAANLYLYVVYLPFYKPVMNIVTIMHGLLFASATMLCAVAYIRDVPAVRVAPWACCACSLWTQTACSVRAHP
jgi:hypothetical protein